MKEPARILLAGETDRYERVAKTIQSFVMPKKTSLPKARKVS